VRNASGKVVKRFALGSRKTATWYRVKWKPKARGCYRLTIRGKDLAGSKQVKVGAAR
jgi:hypothetical protein